MSAPEPVTRASLLGPVHPIVAAQPMSLLPERRWTAAQWQRIQLGFLPQEMEDRWVVFAEDNVVYIHRSWTGFGVFEATFEPDGTSHFQIASGRVESDPDRYRRSSAEYDQVMVELILVAIVLGEPSDDLYTRFDALRWQRPDS